MSNSGRWVFDKDMQKMVKVSDMIPKLASKIDGVYFREPYMENFGGAGRKPGVMVTSKGHKKALMKERGIEEFEESLTDVKPDVQGKTLYFLPTAKTQKKAKTRKRRA